MSREYAYYLPYRDEIVISDRKWSGRKVARPMIEAGTFYKPDGFYYVVNNTFIYLGAV